MLKVGELRPFTGNVTTLNWIGPRPPAAVEANLGYGPGRLANGYWVILLKHVLKPADFELEGTTLRSGGKYGLPGQTAAADSARMRVHDDILRRRGQAGYMEMQEHVLRTTRITGPARIAKVIPVSPHDSAMAPADQYPMGGGGLQWTIKKDRPCLFLVAMQVDRDGVATTPSFSASLADGGPFEALYANRVKVRQYLETA